MAAMLLAEESLLFFLDKKPYKLQYHETVQKYTVQLSFRQKPSIFTTQNGIYPIYKCPSHTPFFPLHFTIARDRHQYMQETNILPPTRFTSPPQTIRTYEIYIFYKDKMPILYKTNKIRGGGDDNSKRIFYIWVFLCGLASVQPQEQKLVTIL